jgi:hypothetical protein
MKEIFTNALKSSYSYQDYRKIIADLLKEGKASGATQTEALVNYSRLNETRMDRLDKTMAVDEAFIYHFKKNGGKFIYCENLNEVKEQFENILEENDWFENEVQCFDSRLFNFLDENRLEYKNATNPSFFFTACENLIADEGSILFSSKQLKQFKIDELPTTQHGN